jgi:hypothetical protein
VIAVVASLDVGNRKLDFEDRGFKCHRLLKTRAGAPVTITEEASRSRPLGAPKDI